MATSLARQALGMFRIFPSWAEEDWEHCSEGFQGPSWLVCPNPKKCPKRPETTIERVAARDLKKIEVRGGILGVHL